jgi:hypothetical protein
MQLLAMVNVLAGAWPRSRDRFVSWLSFSNSAAVL